MTIVYKSSQEAWYASFTVNVETQEAKFGSNSELSYQSTIALDLGTETALTVYNGKEFIEIENPRFLRQSESKVQKLSKQLRRKRSPNYKKKVRASKRWKKARKRVSKLQRKVANQRRNWQHQVTREIARRSDREVGNKKNDS